MDKKKWIVIIAAVAVVSFVLGFLVRIQIEKPDENDKGEAQVVVIENEVSNITVRIREGYVEWYDGTTWNRAQTVGELQAEDSYYIAQQGLEEFEADYLIKIEDSNTLSTEGDSMIMSEPLVGSEKRPASESTTQTVPQPTDNGGQEQVAATTGQTPSTGSSQSGTTTSTTTTPSNPTTPSTSETPATPATPDTPTDSGTGDGEDIGWSDDYL